MSLFQSVIKKLKNMSIFFRKPWQFSWEITRSWAESLCVLVSGCLGGKYWRERVYSFYPVWFQMSLSRYLVGLMWDWDTNCCSYSAFNFSFHKLCLTLKDWFLIRFPSHFQEDSCCPQLARSCFGGSKDKTLKQVKVDREGVHKIWIPALQIL